MLVIMPYQGNCIKKGGINLSYEGLKTHKRKRITYYL